MKFKVQYKGRADAPHPDNPEVTLYTGEETGKWSDLGGQPDDMDKAAAEQWMAQAQGTDAGLQLRVVNA